MDTNVITYLACICFLFIFGRIFIVPIKKILKLVINSILGGVTIFLINLFLIHIINKVILWKYTLSIKK